MLKCGMSEVNITPPLGTEIPGYFHARIASGIKDELYAKAMVLDDGERVVALIAIDAIAIGKTQVQEIRKRSFEMTGILEKNIMVSATHSHTGGPVESWGEFIHKDDEYLSYLVKKSADAAVLAFNSRKPVRIGWGVGTENGIGFNRRYLMKDGTLRTNPGIKNPDIVKAAGPIDPDVTVMRIDDLDGKPIGVVTNFACHLDVVSGTEFCADYPGELSTVLKKVLGQEVVSLFLTGACGNINHIDVSGKFVTSANHYKRMGKVLAGEVLKCREKIDVTDNVKLASEIAVLAVEVRSPSEEYIEKAEDTIRSTTGEIDELIKSSYGQLIELFYAKEAVRMYYEKEKVTEIDIQVISVGELGIVGLSGEIFVEFGLEIKNRSVFQYNMINTLANGSNGYVPTRDALYSGGYESRLCSSSKLEADAGYKMVDKAVEILSELKD